jgi:basic membrane protein A and related proteins
MVQEMIDGTFVPNDVYFDVDSGALGLLGFMEGQTPSPAVPEEIIPQVEALLDQMLAGEFDRFDIFTGPIYNNQGELIIPEGVTLTQSDLEGIVEAIAEETGREACTYCMNWLAEGVSPEAELP